MREDRQRRDKLDEVIAVRPDFSNRRSRILLTLLRRDLRVGLHQAMPSWLTTPRTGLVIRKTTQSVESSPGTWKRFWPASVNATGTFQASWKRNFASFLIVGS
jgi:hypothetical protein